jgi:hypothetical protein
VGRIQREYKTASGQRLIPRFKGKLRKPITGDGSDAVLRVFTHKF